MKAQILKHTGLTEKQFYAKYKTQKDFENSKEGKAFLKARTGSAISKAQTGILQGPEQAPTGNYYQDNNPYFANTPGATGINNPAIATPSSNFKLDPSMITGAMQKLKGVVDTFGAQKKRKQELKQENKLLGLTERLGDTPDVNLPLQKQVLDSPENYIASTNMFYPAQGTGYDVLRGVGRGGLNIRKAQEGFVEGMGMDSAGYDYYEGASEPVNVQEMQAITEAQPDPNQMSDEQATAFMEMYNRDQGISTETFDSNSARDTWVAKTGMPWSEAKRLGYTDGSAKDNTKLLNELKDPRFKKENLRTTAPKKSSPSRTPIQHRETPTGRLAPIKKPLTFKKYEGPELKQSTKSSYDRQLEQRRKQAEFDDDLYGERILTYLANPSKLVGDIRSVLNPMFTTDDETSESDRKEVMANRYNPTLTKAQKLKNVTMMGLEKTPEAAANVASVLSMTPYTTYKAFPVGLPQAAVRRAGFLGQGAKRLPQAPPKMLNQPFTPNFVMYQQGGEIQNTYAPGYLYDDLGYEPLNDSDQVKQYAFGGNMFSGDVSGASSMMGSMFNNNAGYQLGSMIPGPAGLFAGMLGGAADNIFGDAGKIKSLENMNQHKQNSIIRNSMYKNLGTSPFRQEGGWVSNDWQPQVIAKFGDHTAEDVYDFAHEGMDSLRSGGHLKDDRYTPVSNRGLETFAEGGELKTHWGGEVEPVSYNPFSDGEGLTYNSYGNSHFEKDSQGRTGIGLSVLKDGGDMGDDPDVEIETNEPISITKDGAVVYGNLNTNKDLLKDFNLPKEYANKKVKHIVNKIIVPKERKLTNQLEKIVSSASGLNTKQEMLRDKTLEAQELGYKMQLKALAADKKNLARYQDYVHQTTDSLSNSLGKEVSQEKFAKNGEISHVLAKGELSQVAKNGKSIYKAQAGTYSSKYGLDPWEGNVSPGNKYGKQTASSYSSEEWDKIADELGYNSEFEKFKKDNPSATAYDYNKHFQEFLMKNPESLKLIKERHNALYRKEPEAEGKLGFGFSAAGLKYLKGAQKAAEAAPAETKKDQEYIPVEQKKKGFPWGSVLANTLRMFEKPFNMPLASSQIASELRDLADNRPEGIYIPHINSMLETPYRYSADADRNAIMSQARAATRMAGNNPAAQAAIMGQVSQAMNQIGSKEAEMNQQTQQGVYNRNIGTVNADRVRNAAIDLDAMDKYAAAVKATRDTEREALRSIGDKTAQNKAENMQYNITQAMYPDYTFNSSGQLVKRPRYVEFDTTGSDASSKGGGGGLAPGYEYTYDANGRIIGTRKSSKSDDDVARNGKSIKKKNLNSNIVKAFKNL